MDNRDLVDDLSNDTPEAEVKANEEFNSKMKETLRELRPFKELILGNEADWKLVKEHIGLYAFNLPMVGNQNITSDFICGIRFCLELIDERCRSFDNAYNQLGKGE